VSDVPISLTAKFRATRLRKSDFPTPPRVVLQRDVSIMHPAHLPPRNGSEVALVNAEHAQRAGQLFDPAAESWVAPAAPGAEVGHGAPGYRPAET
jgi:hypothetical protein